MWESEKSASKLSKMLNLTLLCTSYLTFDFKFEFSMQFWCIGLGPSQYSTELWPCMSLIKKVTKRQENGIFVQKPCNMPLISSLYAPNISFYGHARCLPTISKHFEHKSWKNDFKPKNLKFFIPLLREPTVQYNLVVC